MCLEMSAWPADADVAMPFRCEEEDEAYVPDYRVTNDVVYVLLHTHWPNRDLSQTRFLMGNRNYQQPIHREYQAGWEFPRGPRHESEMPWQAARRIVTTTCSLTPTDATFYTRDQLLDQPGILGRQHIVWGHEPYYNNMPMPSILPSASRQYNKWAWLSIEDMLYVKTGHLWPSVMTIIARLNMGTMADALRGGLHD